MSFFDDLFKAVAAGAADLARGELANLQEQAQVDAEVFLEDSKDDLVRWQELLTEGRITRREFADLLEARIALAKMAALTEAGIALARLDRFKAGLTQLVVTSAFKVIGV